MRARQSVRAPSMVPPGQPRFPDHVMTSGLGRRSRGARALRRLKGEEWLCARKMPGGGLQALLPVLTVPLLCL